MGRMSGADADQLEGLGNHMRAAADRLEAIRGQVTADLNRSPWEGGDAEHFRGQWHYRLSGLLHTAVLATRSASTSLHANAAQQRKASASTGGSPIAGSAPWAGTGGSVGQVRVSSDPVGDFFVAAGALTSGASTINKVFERLAQFSHREGWAARLGYRLFPKQSGRVAGLIRRQLPTLLKDVAVDATGPAGKGLAGLVKGLGKVGGPLEVVTTGVDGAAFLHDLSRDPHSDDTYNAGADVFFDVASMATVWCPPVSIGIGVIGMGYHIAEHFDPHLTKDIVHDVGAAASFVGHTVTDVGKAELNDVAQRAGAVGSVVSGGVNAVSKLLHF